VAFGTYVSLFPQLIAGPIVRYADIEAELRERHHTLSAAAKGVATFSAGLAKKVLLANPAGEAAESLCEHADSGLAALLWLILFSAQIYFDFSGYSDMAVGLGRILGFTFPENFRYPYVSRSITEFWRRWHITLSSWFREYVYIPLGGNRRGRARTYLNLLAVWSLTGLWHGASVNFLLWGLYFFLILWMEKAFLLRILSRLPVLLQHGYALALILGGWLIFAADGTRELLPLLSLLLGKGPFANEGSLYELQRLFPLLLLLTVGATPLPKRLFGRWEDRLPTLWGVLRTALSLGGLLLSTAYLADSGYNPFLYFRF
jgi:alginate O-acetyltransferase complex protein AlgI